MTGLDARLRVDHRLDVAFTALPGEVVAVVGPNGAGKSTLLHALAGLEQASGHVGVDGTDLLALPAADRNVGMVFQDQRLFPHLTALANVAFGPRSRGLDRGAAQARALTWLGRLGVADLAARKPGHLSGGQAQRVAIARALATEPRLLLLDEPFAGLDISVAASLRIELAHHLDAYDGITVLVTHDALDALTLATSVLVLDEGRVEQLGPPAEVAARPLTEHAARLVGLNVVRRTDDLIAFPPNAVTVTADQPTGSARHRWEGIVRGAAPHGDAIRLEVAVDEDGATGRTPRTLLADVTPAATRELGLAPGRRVWLSVKATAVSSYAATASAVDSQR